ncbi:metallophosphoesterase family protein [Haliangium ochraceum]|uniref:Metallophosphoesterase n=1 Tax=Haliangium ochraceum (strain DSM 14365 / JCM 11303 / SMP-2) TaxID=502025 RepID=D0LMB8_HALO1|nr:metallophosphoesterase [Haliangium ochraceum]ACY16824.1 metallophosphoesterase [Haliangium ochraceum DSM 14365]
MSKKYKSVEARYYEAREQVYRSLQQLDRRGFLKASAAAMGAAAASGVLPPGTFANVRVASAATENGDGGFRFAYISDSHLYPETKNDRFVRALMRAVEDINRLDPQPDFVFYGGDLAQLGRPDELGLGAQILKEVKAPLKMMVGEHDWYYDMGETWRGLFGEPRYSWDHKGVHLVVLNSVIEEDFWTARGLTPEQRMQTVAGLDNGAQNPFTVGDEQIAWLKNDLAQVDRNTPIIVFSHSPLYKLYKKWNFWTDDAEKVQAVLQPFRKVTVIHGHTHQILTNRIGNIHFHGMLSTAWPWPYAPEGMPEYTVEMSRPDPFNPNDGCGDGQVIVHPDGLVDKIYELWNRNPITVKKSYLSSSGKSARPLPPGRPSY